MTLHISNGDHAAERIRFAGITGDVVPWRDVLHEGPALNRADLPNIWPKSDNWRIARLMSRDELLNTDIGQFLDQI